MAVREITAFSSKDWNVYRYILKHPSTHIDDIVKKYGQPAECRITDLLHSGLIYFDGWEDKEIRLDGRELTGKAPNHRYIIKDDMLRHYEDYRDLQKRSGIQFWFPILISCALSIAALIVSLVK